MNTDTINPTGIDNLDREQIGDTEEFVRSEPHRQAEPDPEAERARQSDRIERRLRDRARARRRLRIRASVGGAAVALIAAGAVAFLAGHVSTESSATQNTAAVQAPTSSGSSAGTLISYQRGAWVATLQRELAQLGYYHGSIDGIYGPDTAAAVKAFQSAHGLTVDGIAGRQTMAAIQQALAAASTPAITPPATVTPANPSQTVKPANLTPATPPANGSPSSPTTGGTSQAGGTSSPGGTSSNGGTSSAGGASSTPSASGAGGSTTSTGAAAAA